MRFVKTNDGSVTAYNEEHHDHYHSLSGAMEEAFEKHVHPLGLRDGMHILDFCFGLGYNSIAACSEASNLRITGLEIDEEIVAAIARMPVPPQLDAAYAPFRHLATTRSATDTKNNRITLLLGDARKTVLHLPPLSFDRVYFDAFAPQKQPELWTVEVFAAVWSTMKPGGLLSTYSCAKWVRANMVAVGFEVRDGPRIGRRSPATIAEKGVQEITE